MTGSERSWLPIYGSKEMRTPKERPLQRQELNSRRSAPVPCCRKCWSLSRSTLHSLSAHCSLTFCSTADAYGFGGEAITRVRCSLFAHYSPTIRSLFAPCDSVELKYLITLYLAYYFIYLFYHSIRGGGRCKSAESVGKLNQELQVSC